MPSRRLPSLAIVRHALSLAAVLSLVGCGGSVDTGPATHGATPANTLSEVDGAAFCASHVADCEAQYPKCDAIRSPYYDEAAAGGGRCVSSSGHSDVSPYPVVQCIPRTVKESFIEPTLGADELIDPATGHCVKVALHAGSPKWSKCEDFMPPCKSTKAGACVPGEGTSAGHCFTRCDTAADCSDPARPHCSWMGQFLGGDYACNGRVRVCRAEPLDEC